MRKVVVAAGQGQPREVVGRRRALALLGARTHTAVMSAQHQVSKPRRVQTHKQQQRGRTRFTTKLQGVPWQPQQYALP